MTSKIHDMTGHPLPESAVDDALEAVRYILLSPERLVKLPPQLGVNIPNIYRCLVLLKAQYIVARAPAPVKAEDVPHFTKKEPIE